jgi:hypothetical protein
MVDVSCNEALASQVGCTNNHQRDRKKVVALCRDWFIIARISCAMVFTIMKREEVE